MTSAENPTNVPAKKSFVTPSGLFFLIGIIVGGLFCYFIPYGAGFDEETHAARIFEISGFDLFPNRTSANRDGILVPKELYEFSYKRRYFQTPAFNLYDPNQFLRTINLDNIITIRSRANYPAVDYFPQAFMGGVGWRIFDLPVLPVIIMCRMAGLLVYVLGTYLAIRLLPVGKWVMLVLGLSPTALYQASTLNADGYTTVASFLFIALVLKFALDETAPIRAREVIGLAAACLALGVAKQGAIVLLPLLLIVPLRRIPSKRARALLGAGMVLAIVLSIGWSVYLQIPDANDVSQSSDSLSGSAAMVLANPLDFLSIFISGAIGSIPRYYREWVGEYGHWLGVVPAAVYWVYPAGLLAALLAEPRVPRFSRKSRRWALFVFFAATAAIVFLFYVLYYRPGFREIMGVQGRYLVPLTPLLFLPLAGLVAVPARFARIARFTAVGAVIATIALYSLGLWATYYTDCGVMLYTGESCSQPVYMNIDKANAPEIEINTSTTVSQSFTLVCAPMDSVEVHVKSVKSAGTGSLHFSLLDEEGLLLDQSEIPAAQIGAGQYQVFPIQSLTGERGQLFEMRLDSQNMPPNQGVVLGTSVGDWYTDGNLSVSGKPQEADLIFHYNCPNPRVGTRN